MKKNLLPVILTAALTSVGTIFAVKQFSKPQTGFLGAESLDVPVNYVSNDALKLNNAAPIDFKNAAENSVKAVVHVKTLISSKTIVARDPLSDFFGGNGLRQYRTPEQMGSGSGVLISSDGYIVTNNHVVSGADKVRVTFYDGKSVEARVVGTDLSTDLAVLKIEEQNLPYMEFGNSDNVHLGEWVLAVGYPLSLDATVTAGIVSAKGRSIGVNARQTRTAIESFIQTDAAVNPGNSGGPLVNTDGQIIGINSAIASPTGSYAGYSYAIPANIVKKASADIIKYGAVQRAYLGIEPRDFKSANSQEVKAFKMDEIEGVLVANLSENGGAKAAGIQKGDFITSVNGVKVLSTPQLNEQLSRFKPGDHVAIQYNRNGTLYATTVELKNLDGTTSLVKDTDALNSLGAKLRALNAQEKRNYNLEQAIVVEQPGRGLLANAQIQKGFIITGINGNAVETSQDLEKALSNNSQVQVEGFYPGKSGMYYYNITTNP